MLRSFEKNAKERKYVAFFWKECLPNPGVAWGPPLGIMCCTVHTITCTGCCLGSTPGYDYVVRVAGWSQLGNSCGSRDLGHNYYNFLLYFASSTSIASSLMRFYTTCGYTWHPCSTFQWSVVTDQWSPIQVQPWPNLLFSILTGT